MMGKKILVTGASGQLGRGLCFVLAKENEVHALARFSMPERLEQLQRMGAQIWQKDGATDTLDDLPTDFDVVFNQALHWGGQTRQEQDECFATNTDFPANLMMHCEKAVFVLGSTGSEYKTSPDPAKEAESLFEGREPYTMSKIAMGRLVRWISLRTGRKSAILRYYYPYAPYLQHPRVDKCFKGRMMGGNPDALMNRSYIRDLLDKTIAAADHASSPPLEINVATNELHTYYELAEIGARVAGVPLDPSVKPGTGENRAGEVPDLTRMNELLGPSVISTEEGFRRYYRARQEGIDWPEDWMFAPPE